MRQIGRVEEVKGKTAVVTVMRQSMCGEHCASCKGGCTPTRQRVSAKNAVGAKAGDLVALELRDSQVLAGAALLYLAPLAAMFLGYFVVDSIWHSEAAGIAASLACMALFFFAARWIDNALKKAGQYQITIVKVLQ